MFRPSRWFALRMVVLLAGLVAAVAVWRLVDGLGGPARLIPELLSLHLERESASEAQRAQRIARDIARLSARRPALEGSRAAAARRLAEEGLERRKTFVASGLSYAYGTTGALMRIAMTDNADLHAAADPLVRSLHDADPRLRLEAAYALSHLQLGARQAHLANRLAQALAGAYDIAVQTYLTRALGDLGPAAADAATVIGPLLSESDPVLVASAAQALGSIGPAAWSLLNEARLVGRLDDADAAVRERCAEALGAIGAFSSEAEAALRALLDDRDAWVRVAAALSLAQMGPPDADILGQLKRGYSLAPRTTIYVEDVVQVIELRRDITAVFNRLGEVPDALIPELVRMARESGDIEPRERAIAQIAGSGGFSPSRAQVLVELLQAPDVLVYYAVVDALIEMGPQVIPLVEPLAAHPQRQVREFADRIITRLQPVVRTRAAFDPAAMSAYELETDSYLRMELAVAMAQTGDRRATDFLLAHADDRVLNGPVLDVVVNRLIGDLRHHRFQPTDNLDARQAALESLVYLGVLTDEQGRAYIADIENPDIGDEIRQHWRAQRSASR
jgi:HEAT repeat protein